MKHLHQALYESAQRAAIYPPLVEHASCSNGTPSGARPNNDALRQDSAPSGAMSTGRRRQDEAEHDTTVANRAAAIVPPNPPLAVQIPGCLPPGYSLDSLLTVSQFALWRQKDIETVRGELPTTKGVIRRTRKDVRIHPRTFLELTLKTKI
ncbi:MAG: hypothetical protein KGL39_55490 [Patescibacteria group bacterium]|nr:hypothetical protein [Patescibacteria group bacterium]